MYSTKSYILTSKEYNYLLAVPNLGRKLHYVNERYYFIGDTEDLSDMLDRLKGVYDNYNEVTKMVVYRCSKEGSLEPFRSILLHS